MQEVLFYKTILANMVLIRNKSLPKEKKKRYVCFPNPYVVLSTHLFELPLVHSATEHNSDTKGAPSMGVKGHASSIIQQSRIILIG